jgi:tetratricopeptide (TPR) repeat protein
MKAVTLVTVVFLNALVFGQHSQSPVNEKPVVLYPGLGTWTHRIATRSPEAQKYFDQGLTLMYGFNRYEARRSFRKALELDPSAAMAQWGLAMALGPYLNMNFDTDMDLKEACNAASAGLATEGVAATERAWLEAAAARCPDYSQPRQYIAAMRALATRFPDDPDAQTFFAESLLLPVRWHFYTPDGKPAEGVEEAQRVLEAVLRRHPYHPGANHLYIHAVEPSLTPERGIPSAQRLMGIVPSAGHMVHMPGHIWLAVGDYDTAIAVNERAAHVDRDYFANTGVVSTYYNNYPHSLAFIAYALAMQGRVAETRKVIETLRGSLGPVMDMMPEMVDVGGMFIGFLEIRIGMWDELLAVSQPTSQNPLFTGMWHYRRAMALVGTGRRAEARKEQAQFQNLKKNFDVKILWGADPIGEVMDLADTVLAARLESDPATAIPLWRNSVALQDKLTYFEPPPWYYPVRESLGAALLRSGDAAAAEAVFREGLRRSPNNGRMLFGLRESLRAQNKTDEMVWVEGEFQKAWKHADIQLRVEDL